MTINQRMALIINTIGVPDILKKTDLGQSALYKIAAGGGVNGITIEKMCKGYPDISIEWVIYGIGEMWKNSTKVENTEGCMMAGGCVLRRVAVMEELLKEKK